MIARLLRYALLFLLPFILYGIWLAIARARARGHENEPGWRDAPLMWLTVSGFALVMAGFVLAAVFDGIERGGTYVPPRIVDGQIVPGEVRREGK